MPPTPLTLIPLTLPPGWAAYGASEADPALSADGPTFWAMDTVYNGAWYGYVVFKQVAPGIAATKVAELAGAGQGRLSAQGDGKLYISAYPKVGNSQGTVVAQVPGFVPFTSQAAQATSAAQAAQRAVDDLKAKLRLV